MDDIDILNDMDNVDLSSVNTDFPLLPKGTYEFTVTEAQVVSSKNREGGKVFEVKAALNQQARSTLGREINAGFPLTFRVGLTPTEKYTQQAIAENLAKFQEAVLGNKGRFMPMEQYIGKTFKANIGIDKTEQYGERNEFLRLLKKA